MIGLLDFPHFIALSAEWILSTGWEKYRERQSVIQILLSELPSRPDSTIGSIN